VVLDLVEDLPRYSHSTRSGHGFDASGQVVEELAQEYKGRLKVMKLNTDEAPEIAGQYQIMSIPSILFFKGGQVVEKIVGARPKQQFKEIIDALLSQSSATA